MTAVPSIKDAFARKKKLEDEATQIWRDLATDLAGRIPEGLRAWAQENSFYPGQMIGDQEYWKLPEWLGWMVQHSEYGGGCSNKYREDELEMYGFESFADLRRKFQELEKAWGGILKITYHEEPGRTEVVWSAAEFLSKQVPA